MIPLLPGSRAFGSAPDAGRTAANAKQSAGDCSLLKGLVGDGIIALRRRRQWPFASDVAACSHNRCLEE